MLAARRASESRSTTSRSSRLGATCWRDPRRDAVSTLLRDASHFEGAITLARGEEGRARLRDDPFARVFPARMLRLGPGIIGAPAAPVGPTIERYGSANPWPWDRFG